MVSVSLRAKRSDLGTLTLLILGIYLSSFASFASTETLPTVPQEPLKLEAADHDLASLIGKLISEDPKVRAEAQLVMNLIAPAMVSTVTVLGSGLEARDFQKRSDALIQLSQIVVAVSSGVRTLSIASVDPRPAIQKESVSNLPMMIAALVRSAAVLRWVFRDDNPELRENAAQVMRHLIKDYHESVALLARAAYASDPEVRAPAESGLNQMALMMSILPELVRASSDENLFVRAEVRKSFAEIRAALEIMIPILNKETRGQVRLSLISSNLSFHRLTTHQDTSVRVFSLSQKQSFEDFLTTLSDQPT